MSKIAIEIKTDKNKGFAVKIEGEKNGHGFFYNGNFFEPENLTSNVKFHLCRFLGED